MRKTSSHTVNVISLLFGDEDLGIGAPRPVPGHVEDRLASMGANAARTDRRRFPRRRVS